jgi:hypothetical protein
MGFKWTLRNNNVYMYTATTIKKLELGRKSGTARWPQESLRSST